MKWLSGLVAVAAFVGFGAQGAMAQDGEKPGAHEKHHGKKHHKKHHKHAAHHGRHHHHKKT